MITIYCVCSKNGKELEAEFIEEVDAKEFLNRNIDRLYLPVIIPEQVTVEDFEQLFNIKLERDNEKENI